MTMPKRMMRTSTYGLAVGLCCAIPLGCCQSRKLDGVSELAGVWAAIEGQTTFTFPDRPTEVSTLTPEMGKEAPFMIIREDGSFELRHTMLALLRVSWDRLRHAGDSSETRQSEGWQGTVRVAESCYTAESSRMVILFRPKCMMDRVTFRAILLPSGIVRFRSVTEGNGCRSVTEAKLRRFKGELPWEKHQDNGIRRWNRVWRNGS